MESVLALAAANLVSPPVLFFLLGALAGFARSDLSLPDAVAKGLSLYLLMAIGFKGGVAAQMHGMTPDFAKAIMLGLVLSVTMPFLAYAAVRVLAGVERLTAAGIAAHYGSISIVTFVAAMDFAEASGLTPGRYLAAVAAIMETPGIVAALFLAARGAGGGTRFSPHLLRDVFLNGSIVLLTGAFLIGLITGAAGMKRLDLFVNGLFTGFLCLFLLEMGLVAARRLSGGAQLRPALIACGVIVPLAGAALGLGGALLLGMNAADAAVLMTLGASASYIAAPAAIRIALPEADPGIYLPLSIGVTFPFNIAVGVPLYAGVALAVIA
ncbi:MAG: sodium-dependent bicarbonate transport family permease [Hyphomonadaceae bacterium]|nr:sodium-dependent bicarbonate transport family permease [Hyphomonadaceae bacterium]